MYKLKFQYDITVLIPIYNAEKTIEETIESLINQQNDQNLKIEILLLNDGSTDNSENICKQYADEYENIKYFAFENSGVSKTRNRGMDLAQGKYILFLDSDDIIAEDTIQENFNIFERYHDEADILAYPLYKYKNNKIIEHPRTKLHKETYLCDVDKFPHFNQPTMNIIIKNLKNEKVYFDESMPYAEDVFFNINMIMRTRKIIVSSKGKYLYRTNTISAVNKFRSPITAANFLMDFYLLLIDKYQLNGKIPKYIQSVILYELNWRLKFDALFPRHLSEEKYKEWENKYLKVLSFIENEVLITNPNMDRFHAYYFLMNKVNKEHLKFELQNNRVLFQYKGNEILKIDKFLIVFSKFKIINNKLVISGFIKEPMLELLEDDLKLYFVNITTGKKTALKLYKSSYGYYKSYEYTNLFLQFDYEFPLNEGVFDFKIELNGFEYDTRYYFLINTMIKTATAKERRVFYNNYCINTINNKINISNNVIRNIKDKIAFYNRLKKHHYGLLYLYKHFKLTSDNKINLYSDRYGQFSEAYQLFKKHLLEKKDEQHFYIFKKNNPINLLTKVSNEERKYFIEFGSLEHKKLFLNANKIYTSSTNVSNYSPFNRKEFNILAENFQFELIWLKGFMNNGFFPKKYAKEVTNVDKVIVKSEKDKLNLINNYNYLEEQIEIIKKDIEKNLNNRKQNHILISFTWRSYLLEYGFKYVEEKKNSRFAKSDYYLNLMKLLNSDEIKFLIQNGYKVDFYLHPYFKVYSDLFNFINMDIKVLHQLESLEPYDILISDYSSLLDAFENEGKRTIKYHIDFDDFKTGSHMFNTVIDNSNYVYNHETLMKLLKELPVGKGV